MHDLVQFMMASWIEIWDYLLLACINGISTKTPSSKPRVIALCSIVACVQENTPKLDVERAERLSNELA